MALKRNVDPVLEKLRNEVEGPPNLDILARNFQRLTKNVHAAYLFEKEGKRTFRELCLLLSATATGKLYSGWQDFAAQLGLSLEQIQCIDYNFKGLQDPTYYVLLAYVQSPEATLDKMLLALREIGRLDVINRIRESMCEFIESLDLDSDANEIRRPRYVPRAPMVLDPLIITRAELQTRRCDSDSEFPESSNLDPQNATQKPSPYYGSIVMLTYAEDGAITAKNAAKMFRAREPKIGVVMLEEQAKHVYSRAEEFIDDCFKQVNYVIPILTRGYIERVHGKPDEAHHERSLNAKYLKYIYSLMRFEYAKSNCCNNRIRCIVPENEVATVIKSDLHPTLQAWFGEADMEALTENILLRKI